MLSTELSRWTDTEKVVCAHGEVLVNTSVQNSTLLGKTNETLKDKYFMFMSVCGIYIEKRHES